MFREYGQPQDAVVSPGIFNKAPNGVKGNLVLPCSVSGSPTPTISWFREGTPVQGGVVTSDGTLVLNVTEGVEASREGRRYYCIATNTLGPSERNFTAMLRSRNVIVSTACESQY